MKDDFVVDFIASLEARLALFFADFEDNNSIISIIEPPPVDRPLLQKAVDDFLTFMKNQKF